MAKVADLKDFKIHHYVPPVRNSDAARVWCPVHKKTGRIGYNTISFDVGYCTWCDAKLKVRKEED